jgi:hypothetical protein
LHVNTFAADTHKAGFVTSETDEQDNTKFAQLISEDDSSSDPAAIENHPPMTATNTGFSFYTQTGVHQTTGRSRLVNEDDDDSVRAFGCNDEVDVAVVVNDASGVSSRGEPATSDISDLIRASMPKPAAKHKRASPIAPNNTAIDISPKHRGKNVAAIKPFGYADHERVVQPAPAKRDTPTGDIQIDALITSALPKPTQVRRVPPNALPAPLVCLLFCVHIYSNTVCAQVAPMNTPHNNSSTVTGDTTLSYSAHYIDDISPPEQLMAISLIIGDEKIRDATCSLPAAENVPASTKLLSDSSGSGLSEDNFDQFEPHANTLATDALQLLSAFEVVWTNAPCTQLSVAQVDEEELSIDCEHLSLVSSARDSIASDATYDAVTDNSVTKQPWPRTVDVTSPTSVSSGGRSPNGEMQRVQKNYMAPVRTTKTAQLRLASQKATAAITSNTQRGAVVARGGGVQSTQRQPAGTRRPSANVTSYLPQQKTRPIPPPKPPKREGTFTRTESDNDPVGA